MALAICLTATNSSGSQRLHIDHDGHGEFHLCMVGLYENAPIQIDFDPVSLADMEDIVSYLQRRIDQHKAAQSQDNHHE